MKLSITTPKELTARIIDFCGSISPVTPRYLEVTPAEDAQPKQCYFNAKRIASRLMVTPVFGWIIWQADELWLEAEHHCVLEAPGGELIDPTPQNDGEVTILFVRDDTQPFDYSRPRAKLKKYYTLSTLDEVERFVEAHKNYNKFLWKYTRFRGEYQETKIVEPKAIRLNQRLRMRVAKKEEALMKALAR